MAWMITDVSALNGTCYIEVLPGRYRQKAWNPESVYFGEEHFGFIEPAIERHFPGFNHYAFNDISVAVWEEILLGLSQLRERITCTSVLSEIEDDVGFIFETTKSNFLASEQANLRQLNEMLDEFIRWARATLKNHDSISILGM